MNELDYVRDNRLRLWFLNRRLPTHHDISKKDRERHFAELLAETLSRLAASIRRGGFVVLVVGDVSRGGRRADTAGVVTSLFRDTPALAGFTLARAIEDSIPDLRRARRDLGGTKRETVLVFRKALVPRHPSAATTPCPRTNDGTTR